MKNFLKNIFNKKSISAQELAVYRKTINVYDVFIFFNELDLLEIRLSILDPYVDYFVIAESTVTFSGKPKPLYFKENKERFKKWEHKIIHQVIEDTPNSKEELQARLASPIPEIEKQIINDALSSTSVPDGEPQWLREFYQRESVKKALTDLRDNDIVYVSDVDEIWNPDAIVDYTNNAVFKLKQKVYAYFLNNRSSEAWAGTFVAKYKIIKQSCLNHLRDKNKTKYTYVKNGGWHFTNQGGAAQIQKKIESYSHQEYNTDAVKEDIAKRMSENRDFIGRNFRFWKDETDLPAYILNNRKSYEHLFK